MELPQSDDWLVFHGEASPAEAHVYVQLRLPQSCEADRLRGEITGPFSRYARTLPATTRFAAPCRDDEFLTAIVLTDPCFWSPELPYLYQVRVALEQSGIEVWSDERAFGIRRLGVRGRRFYFEAKNWVLRGAHAQESTAFPWEDWREHCLTAFVREPSEAFCREADRHGVLLAALLEQPAHLQSALLNSWQRHPAVGFIVCEASADLSSETRHAAINSILVAKLTSDFRSLPPWADAAWAESPVAIAATALAIEAPFLAVQRSPGNRSPAEFRAACDRWQRELAGTGEFAGYIV